MKLDMVAHYFESRPIVVADRKAVYYMHIHDLPASGADQMVVRPGFRIETLFFRIARKLRDPSAALERFQGIVDGRDGHGREIPSHHLVHIVGRWVRTIAVQIVEYGYPLRGEL